MGYQPADESGRPVLTTEDEPLQRPIDDLMLSTRALTCLKRAGINTIGELARLTEEELRDIRNFGARCAEEVSAKLRELELQGPAVLVQSSRGTPTMTRRQVKHAQRLATGEAVLEVAKEHPGRALTFSEIHHMVVDRLEFVPDVDDVRECLRVHVKTTDYFAKVARDVFAWAPDGEIPPPPAPPHVADMIERRWRGDTLDEIGADHGVTRERIRQLLKKYGGPTAEEVRGRRTARELEEQLEREGAIGAAVRRALDERGPMTVAEVAEISAYDPVEISKAWPRDLAHLRLHAAGNYENRWSDEAILEAIRQAALYEYPLTTNAYAELVSQGQVQGPSMPRIWQRFGSWTAACEAAGVVPGRTMRRHYESRWSDDDLLRVARQYLLDPSAANSAGRFDEWRRAVVPDGPSFQTLRNRFGSWTEVKRRALAQEDGAK